MKSPSPVEPRARLASERELYPALLRHFRKQHLAFAEVPVANKHVDLLFTSSGLRNFYAVETKLSDWRTALKQAALNQLFVQYSFVALPETRFDSLDERILNVFVSHSVGLIKVGETTEVVIRARRTNYTRRSGYRQLKALLRSLCRSRNGRKNGANQPARALELIQARTDKRKGTI